MERHEGAADGPVAAAATDGIARMQERRAAKPFRHSPSLSSRSSAGTTWLIRRMRASMTDTPFENDDHGWICPHTMFLFPAPLDRAAVAHSRALGIDDYAHPDMPPKPLLLTMTEAGGQARFQELDAAATGRRSCSCTAWLARKLRGAQARLRLVRDTTTRRASCSSYQSDQDPDPDLPAAGCPRGSGGVGRGRGSPLLGEVAPRPATAWTPLEQMAQEGRRIMG